MIIYRMRVFATQHAMSEMVNYRLTRPTHLTTSRVTISNADDIGVSHALRGAGTGMRWIMNVNTDGAGAVRVVTVMCLSFSDRVTDFVNANAGDDASRAAMMRILFIGCIKF